MRRCLGGRDGGDTCCIWQCRRSRKPAHRSRSTRTSAGSGRTTRSGVDRYDDPRIANVSCYLSRAQTGGASGGNWACRGPEPVLLACRVAGPGSRCRPSSPDRNRRLRRSASLFVQIVPDPPHAGDPEKNVLGLHGRQHAADQTARHTTASAWSPGRRALTRRTIAASARPAAARRCSLRDSAVNRCKTDGAGRQTRPDRCQDAIAAGGNYQTNAGRQATGESGGASGSLGCGWIVAQCAMNRRPRSSRRRYRPRRRQRYRCAAHRRPPAPWGAADRPSSTPGRRRPSLACRSSERRRRSPRSVAPEAAGSPARRHGSLRDRIGADHGQARVHAVPQRVFVGA